MKIFISSLLLLVTVKRILAQVEPATFQGLNELQCSYVCVPKPTKVIMDASSPKPTKVIMDVSSPKPTEVIMDASSPKPTKVIMDVSSPKPTNVIMDVSSPKPTEVIMDISSIKPTKVIMDNSSPKPTKVIMDVSSPKPNSCNEVVSSYHSKIVVTLSSGLEVMCDTETDGGGWLVIQSRINGKLNFYRGWEDYKKGFGDYVNGDFYLGNENINRISTNGSYELRIDMEYHNVKYYAHFSRFFLSNEFDGYRLNVNGYSGNAGDSLTYHNGLRFSTFDRSNIHCAVQFQGAWWYNACATSNLNGLWGWNYYQGVFWQYITHGYSLSKSEMKIRKTI